MFKMCGLDSSSDEEIIHSLHNGLFNNIRRNPTTFSSSIMNESTIFSEDEPDSSDSEEQKRYMEVGIQCDILTKSKIPFKTVISVIKKCLYIETDCIGCMKELIDLCKTLKHECFKTGNEDPKEDNVELLKASELTKGSVEEDAIPTEFQPSRSCSKQNSAESFHHMTPSTPSKAVGETNEQIQNNNGRRCSNRIKRPPTRRYLGLEHSLLKMNSEKGSKRKVDAITSRKKVLPIKRARKEEKIQLKTNSIRNNVIPNKRSSDIINGKQTQGWSLQRCMSQNWSFENLSQVRDLDRSEALGRSDLLVTSLEENHRVRRLYSPTSWLDSDESIKFAEKRTSSNEFS